MSRVPGQRPTGPLTLRQLVDEPSLGLAVAEPGDLSTVVRGAHSIEIEDAARWLRPGWIMLTTGLRFLERPQDEAPQALLVDQLVDAGAAALLFGIGVHFDEVPAGLREAARERRLPLLTVSAGTPFAAVEEFVNRGTLSSEIYLLRRTVWLQNDLLKALSATDPATALVTRLATLSKGAAVLYETSGRIIASTGHGPLRLIWEEIAAREAAPQRFSVGRWAVASRPFLLRGAGFRLAIASRSGPLIDDLGPDLLETAERVLAAANAVRDLTMNQERAEAARLVSALQAGVPASRIRQTWDRLRPFRFRVGGELRVIAASPLAPWRVSVDPRRPSDALLEEAHLEGLGLILSEQDEPDPLGSPLTAVLADGPAADGWLTLLSGTHLTGVSGPFADLTVAPQYFREALTALRVATRRHAVGASTRIVRLDEVDFATWLLTRRDDAQVAARFDRHFGALVRAGGLAETVIMYLACQQDVKKTAERLFVHPNTVRYRLHKVEQQMGAPITAAGVVANLYLAFQDEILALS
ncbi:PucR family transcriptional regulator [Pseudonocardia hispaniensis]|uniref:PucR family transcriptional regulator n=1 Tax=Pseudonocardia hispaniensis TaxID=904933 RepID=A0ABW1IXD9_9PSEU